MALFYSEWCDKHGFDYTCEARRAAWQAYCFNLIGDNMRETFFAMRPVAGPAGVRG
jgi:hypothetical protein